MEFDGVKQERKAIRTAFTKTVNKLDDLLKSAQPDIEEIEIRLEQLYEKYNTLRDIDKKFFELYQKSGCSQEDFDKEYEAAQDYYDKFAEYKVKTNLRNRKNQR